MPDYQTKSRMPPVLFRGEPSNAEISANRLPLDIPLLYLSSLQDAHIPAPFGETLAVEKAQQRQRVFAIAADQLPAFTPSPRR